MRNFTDIFGVNEAQSEETQRLRQIKNKAHNKVQTLKKKGADPALIAAAEQELAEAWANYNAGKAADKAGVVPSKQVKSGPTPKPRGVGKDWDDGYKAALEAIKQATQGSGGQGGSDSGGDSSLEGIPLDPEDLDPQSGGSGNSGSGQGGDGSMEDQLGQAGGSGNSGQSRNGKQSGQGVVRPEDCTQVGDDLDKTPGTAGGMIDKSTGDKISEAEGYDKAGGNEESQAKEWGERARRAASQMQGKGEGYERLRGTIEDLYKATKDWKKELKKLVGQSISPEDKRQAYANKNILISQDRIARTDKDKYDCMDYMVVAIDTSGSMTEEYMQQCLAEIYAIALAKKPIKLVILQFDTRITDIQEFTNLNELKKKIKLHQIHLKGGGGTECKPVFDLLLKDPKFKRRPAELLMIFTDGYLTQYPRNIRTMKNLIWVVIDNMGFDLEKKDAHTKVVRIKSSDIYGK